MARPFADVLRELAGGTVYEELTAALADVVSGVNETRKAGSLTLALKVKPNGDSSVMVSSEIKTKVPEMPKGETLFFTTSSGSLVRQDPRQQDLPLRQVPGAAPAVTGGANG